MRTLLAQVWYCGTWYILELQLHRPATEDLSYQTFVECPLLGNGKPITSHLQTPSRLPSWSYRMLESEKNNKLLWHSTQFARQTAESRGVEARILKNIRVFRHEQQWSRLRLGATSFLILNISCSAWRWLGKHSSALLELDSLAAAPSADRIMTIILKVTIQYS